MMRIRNISKAPRSIDTADGRRVYVGPGEEVDEEVDERQEGVLRRRRQFWSLGGSSEPTSEVTGPTTNDSAQLSEALDRVAELERQLSESQSRVAELETQVGELTEKLRAHGDVEQEQVEYTDLEAKHRGSGSYSVMNGDVELVRGLDKEGAQAFNVMDDAGKNQYVRDAQASNISE